MDTASRFKLAKYFNPLGELMGDTSNPNKRGKKARRAKNKRARAARKKNW